VKTDHGDQREIYLDAAATTRPAPEVLEAMLPCLDDLFGNPSSLHRRGVETARAIDDARTEVARSLGRDRGEVVFTSGATEANNLALRGATLAQRRRGDHIVATAVEHPSVLEPLRALESEGFRLSLAPVERDGTIDPGKVLALVEEKTVLLSVMHVQNETGAVFPVESIAKRAKAKRPGLIVHSDGVQAWGKLEAPDRSVDLYVVSGHKVHGPQGAGALAIAKGTRVLAQVFGGGQEGGLRAGTENVAAIVGLGVAARLARERLSFRRSTARALRGRLEAGLRALGATILSPNESVPNTINASFPGAAAEPLLHALEQRGIIVSSGSACSSKKSGHGRSHVLDAMGLPDELKKSSLRLSFSADETGEREIDAALAALRELYHGTLARSL
jgi:cysteine desulfurase